MIWHVRVAIPVIVTVSAVALCLASVALLATQLEETIEEQYVRELDHNVNVFLQQFEGSTRRALKNTKVLANHILHSTIKMPTSDAAKDLDAPAGRDAIDLLKGCATETLAVISFYWRNTVRLGYGPRVFPTGPMIYNTSASAIFTINSFGWNTSTSQHYFIRSFDRIANATFEVSFPATLAAGERAAATQSLADPHWSEVATTRSLLTTMAYMLPLPSPDGSVDGALVGFINTIDLVRSIQSIDYFLLYRQEGIDTTVLAASNTSIPLVQERAGENVPHPDCLPSISSAPSCFLLPHKIQSPRLQDLISAEPEFFNGEGPDEVSLPMFLARRVTLSLREYRRGATTDVATRPFYAIVMVNLTDPTDKKTLLTFHRRSFDPVGYVAYAVIAAVFALVVTVPSVMMSMKPLLMLPRTLRAASRLRSGGTVRKISRFSEVASLQLSYNATKHKLDEMMRFLPHYILVRIVAEQSAGSSSGGTSGGVSDDDDEELTSVLSPSTNGEGTLDTSSFGLKSGMSRMAEMPANDVVPAAPVLSLDALLGDSAQGAFVDCRCTVMYLLLDVPEGRGDGDDEIPAESVAQRQTFLSSAIAEVTRHGGVVESLTGRSLTATFNCHTSVARHQEQGSLAAINIHRFAEASTAATFPFAIMLDADHAASVTVGCAGARSRLVISRALSVCKKIAPLLLAHGCRVGATDRVTSVAPLQHVPLDSVRLNLDFASTSLPSGVDRTEKVSLLLDSEKTDDFDDSVLFVNTAFDEMRAGDFRAALRQWQVAERKASTEGGSLAGPYNVERIRRMAHLCAGLGERVGSAPYCNTERLGFRSWASETRFTGAPTTVVPPAKNGNGSGGQVQEMPTVLMGGSATGTFMGDSYTGADDPPMFGDSYTALDGSSSAPGEATGLFEFH